MNLRNILLLIVAVAIAGVTAVMARNWLTSQREAMRPKPVAPVVQAATYVLVAKAHLKPGTFVQPGHIDWVAWPKEGVVKGFVVKNDKVKMENFVGSVARTSVLPGEPIIETRFVKPGDRGFMAAVLTPGNRAATVPINATSGNAGFIFPGDRVDLILTSKFGERADTGEGQRNYAATIVRNLRVLAIDQKTENAKGETAIGRTATLEVTPREAEMVALALQMGNIALSLRPLAGEPGESNGEPIADNGDESVILAEAPAIESGIKKSSNDNENTYIVDKDLKFMLEDRSKAGVTVLRGSMGK